MFADGDVGPEQDRVDGPRAGARVVYVVAVDADEDRARPDQPGRGGLRQIRVIGEIGLGSPVRVPTRVDEHGLAADVEMSEVGGVGGEAVRVRAADDDRVEVRKRRQIELRQIAAVGVAVDGAST